MDRDINPNTDRYVVRHALLKMDSHRQTHIAIDTHSQTKHTCKPT